MLGKKRTFSLPRVTLVLFCLVLSVAGCAPKSATDRVAERFADGMEGALDLSMAVHFYYVVNNRWPEDVDAVKAFYANTQYPFPKMDWSKYTNTSFQIQPDGKLRIDFHNPEGEQGQEQLDASVILGPPVVKSDSAQP